MKRFGLECASIWSKPGFSSFRMLAFRIFRPFNWFRRRAGESPLRIVYTKAFLKTGNQDGEKQCDGMDKFCSNALVSSRYTWFNFVPKNAFEQFHNMANIFFALLSVIFSFAEGATSVWATLGPLIAIIFMTMVKDAVDDYFRHRRDKAINRMRYAVLDIDPTSGRPQWTDRTAESLCVGDVIYCEKDTAFPSDIVLLASSNPSTEVDVTTVNLDGESNIKKYFAVMSTQTAYFDCSSNAALNRSTQSADEIAKSLYTKVVCQSPNVDLTNFEGHISRHDNPENQEPLTVWNVALRGAKLKNTDFAIGLIVYTGRETKLSLNSKHSVRKYSSREARSNLILLAFILAMVVLSVIFATAYTVWTKRNGENMWFLPPDKATPWAFVQNTFRFAFIFCYLIPISMIITMELQQILIAYFISNDISMYSADEDLCSKANSSQLADELGQVEFLFTDKTGTLTENVMSLHRVAMLRSNQVYNWSSKPRDQNESSFSSSSSSSSEEDSGDGYVSVADFRQCNNKRYTSRMAPSHQRVDDEDRESMESSFNEWLTIAALCHTVTCVSTEGTVKYEACSTDEKAIVEGCSRYGVIFLGSSKRTDISSSEGQYYRLMYRTSGDPITNATKLQQDYSVDAVLDFTATRKRMSVMVRHTDGTHHVHSKGAELVMLNTEVCCSRAHEVENLRSRAMHRVNEFARSGLRTLVFSTRQLYPQEYNWLLDEHRAALRLLGAERKVALENVYAKIESDLRPVAVTGIEDQLQEGVSECLASLREAGIQVWILTGDNEETAITVSQSAKHLPANAGLIRLTGGVEYRNVAASLFNHLEGLRMRAAERNLLHTRGRFSRRNPPKQVGEAGHRGYLRVSQRRRAFRACRRPGAAREPIGLVVDGMTLHFLLDPDLRDFFLDLCMGVTTVLCCRLTPLQKAAVVQLVQTGISKLSGRTPVTAAVGDGGNDVAMLNQATIGVGIYGKEGREASRASDYSLTEFRHLKRLFLFHGHLSYHRLSFTMCIFYFKCVAFVTTQTLLVFYNGFSQMVTYDSLQFALFNLTMTSIITLLYGCFEEHLTEQEILRCPYIYRKISHQANLQLWYVLLWIADGLWQGAVTFFLAIYILVGGQVYGDAVYFDLGSGGNQPYQFDHGLFGCALFTFIWTAVTLRVLILSRNLNWIVCLGFLVTVANTGLLFLYERTSGYQSILYFNYTRLLASPVFWLAFVLAVVTANLPALLWRLLSDTWWYMQLSLGERSHGKLRRHLRRDWRNWVYALIRETRSSANKCTKLTKIDLELQFKIRKSIPLTE